MMERADRQIEAEEVQALLGDGDCELLDVREDMEWAGGRIPRARHIPLGELGRRCEELDPGRPLILMCQSGARSARAAGLLREKGFASISELKGGLQAWIGAGLETERDDRAPWALDRQVRLAAGSLVLLGLVMSLIWPWMIGLSWFVGAGLVFAALTNTCAMGMMLAKAPWNRKRQHCCGDRGERSEVS